MKRVLAVLALSGLMACTTGRPCTSDAECTAFQAVCDPELKVCVSATDPDGGSACGSGCADWQTCRPGAGGGSCVGLTVRIVSPLPNTEYGGSASVRLVASVTDWDGGAWGGTSIPASGSTGVAAPASLMRIGAGQYQGDYGLPDTAGTHTLIAGWSGASASVPVVTQVCSVACADWQECLPSANGGVCGDLGLTLTWNSPAANAKFPTNVSVPLALAVTRADGGAFARDIPFTVTSGSPGMLSPAGGNSWTGSTNSGSVDTTRTLVAGWAGGPQSSGRDFIVDATPPALSLVVRTDGGSYQRDAIIPALLVSSEDLADAGVTLDGVAMPRVADINCPDFGATAGAAGCFELDFSQPALSGISGTFSTLLSATDTFGNSGSGSGATLPVTRERWSTCPAGCALGTDVTAMSVAPDGGLYVGFSKTIATGVVVRLSAINGVSVSGWDAGAVQSLASSNDVVFFAMNDSVSGGQIGAFGPVTSVTRPPCFQAATNATFSGIALLRDSVKGVGAIGSINSPNGTGCAYFPVVPTVYFGAGSTYDSFSVTSLSTPTASVNVLISDAVTSSPVASFLRKAPATVAAWQPVANFLGSPDAGAAQPLTTAAAIPAVGQILLSANQVLMTAVSPGAGSDVFVGEWIGGLGPQIVRSGNLGEPKTTGVPVTAGAREAYAGRGSGLYRFNPEALDASTLVVDDGGIDNFYLSPVLSKDQPEDGGIGLGYAVSADGILVAFSREPTASLQWQAAASEPVLTHPTLDCNRQSTRTKTGLLYIGAKGGRVRAYVVDSPGLLDTPDAWPKYQRSMGNAGNDDLTNFPTNWPGCP